MGTIECPVCTLYLRADMSLEDHLETHPKEKVIQALVAMAMKPKAAAAAPQAPAPQLQHQQQQQQLEVVRSRTPPNALMYHHTGNSNSNSSGGYEQIQQPQQHHHQQPMMAAPTAIAVVKASDMGGYPINNVMIVKSCSTKYVQQLPSGSNVANAAYTSGPIDGRSIFIEPDRGGGGGVSAVRRQLGAPGPSLYPPRYTNERYSGPPPPYSTAISSTISSGSQSSGYGSKYQAEQKPPPQAFYPNPPPPIVQTTPTIAHHQHYYTTAPPPPPPPPPPPHMSATMHQLPSSSGGFFKGGHVQRSTLQAQYTEKDDGNFVVTENPKKVVEYTENDEGDFMVIEKIIKSPPRIIQIVDEVEPASPKEKVCEEDEQVELVQQREDREDSEYEMEIEEQYQVEEVQKSKQEEEVEQQQLGTIQIVENEDGTFDDNQQYGLKEMPKPMLIGGIGGSPKKCHKFNFIVEPTASSSAGSSATGSPYTPRKKPTSGLKVLSNVKVTTDLSQGIKDIILNLNCKNKGVNVAGSSSGASEAAGTSSGVNSLKTSLITGVVNNNCQNELIINNMPPIDLNDVNDIEIINDDEEDLRPGEDEECYIGSMEVKAAEVPAPTTPTPSVITSVIRMTPHPSPVVAPPSPPALPAKLETIDPEPVDPPKPSTSEVTITKPTPRKPAPQHQTPSTSTGSLFHKPPKKLTVKLKTPLPPAPPPTPPLIPTSSLKQEAQPMDLDQPSTSEDCKPHVYFVPVESATSAPPETKFCPEDHPQISSPQPTTLTLTECSSTEVTRNGPLETIAVTTTTTKIEQQDAMQISETIVYTQSSSPEAAAEHQHQSASPGPSGVVETTTTSVEYYNITIIDDEAVGAAAAAAAQGQSSTEEQLPEEVDGVKPEVEQDQKVALYEVKIAEYEPEREPDSPGSSGCDEPETKSCIKVEKMEVMESSGSVAAPPVDESEKKVLVAKVEPVSVVDTSGEYHKDDHKDFLEAGPSRTVTTVDGEGSSSSSSSSSAIASSSQAVVVSSAGPTFLEYSAEYDDYVPVTSYGMPQEQIPLSWVQKFSPQYTPFDDQNSYMDLDQTDSKTNSNSVGGNSSATSSGGSGSRIETSMDRAPSAESLNIRTDEKMPAKGEISEQESNGDMELSWNRLYPVHENIPIYPSSYDLSTAQECWNLSNRSSTVTGLNQDHPHHGQQQPQQQQQQYHHHHHLSSSSSSSQHHRQQHGHQHGISFQFSSHDQPRPLAEDDDGLVDDKSKIHLEYGGGAGASGSGTNNYLGLGASSSGGVTDHHTKLAHKVRTYRCTECPKSFSLLKQRRAHMQAEHHEAVVDSKLNVLATAASAVAASATVTSGAFFSNPGEGSSGTTTAATTTLLSKKIKIEPQPVLMSYSSLKLELEQKQEGGSGLDMAGPSTSGMGSSGLGGSGGEVRRKRTYVCGTCKQEFDRFKLFNAHLMTHPAECYTCGRSFKHWPNFALHIKRHLGIKDHQCRLCGKKFVIKQKLIEHMRVHTGKAPIKCPDCDQHFRRFSNLAQHRNRHHLNKVPSKKDFVCHCGEVFQSKAKMEWHKEIHENKPKSCPFCREKFIHKNSLTRHIRLSHTEKYVKLETATEMCTICNQPYIKTSMKRHMETHTEERLAYSCTICNKLFSTNWNLKQHKWTHANPTLKPFQCNLCSSGFVREADYVTHMNAHKSIRPYTCNHCGCQFIRKYNWIRHTREHETEKNYSCEICNRKFHRKYYLTEHKRIHTGERPFSCNICGKTSSTKTNHNKHIKIHHARDPLTAEG